MQLAASARQDIISDGYIVLPSGHIDWAVSLDALRRGIEQLHAHGWPASFVFVYDEAWAMLHCVSALLRAGVRCAVLRALRPGLTAVLMTCQQPAVIAGVAHHQRQMV
jgi:hypothetical protein